MLKEALELVLAPPSLALEVQAVEDEVEAGALVLKALAPSCSTLEVLSRCGANCCCPPCLPLEA